MGFLGLAILMVAIGVLIGGFADYPLYGYAIMLITFWGLSVMIWFMFKASGYFWVRGLEFKR